MVTPFKLTFIFECFRPKITHGKCGKEEGFWWVVDSSAVLFLAPLWCRGRGFSSFPLKKNKLVDLEPNNCANLQNIMDRQPLFGTAGWWGKACFFANRQFDGGGFQKCFFMAGKADFELSGTSSTNGLAFFRKFRVPVFNLS